MIVFSHLDMKNRLQACLVCKKWLELINCRSLLSDITVFIRCSTFENYSNPCMTRNFMNFNMLEMSTDDKWKNGIQYISPYVEYLSLCNCDMDRNMILSLDMTLENLIALDIFTDDAWRVFPSCPNLLMISIYSNSFTDSFIAVMQKTMKRLEVFTLYTAVVDDPSKYRKYYPPGVTYEENPSSEVLSFPAIRSFVSERASTLSEIDLREISLSVSTLTELLSVKGLNLTRLCLYTEETNSPDSSKFFTTLFRRHQNLKLLNISGFNLKDDVKETFCVFLPNIEELVMTCRMSDKSLKDIFNLKNLKTLSILVCAGFTRWGCREAICVFKSLQIKHLTLQYFLLPKDSAFAFKELIYLVQLNLSLSHVTDSHVHVISTYLVNLENLDLSENSGISDYGITAVSNPEGTQINTSSDNVTGFKALHNLKRLVILDLSWCTKITNDGLIAAIRFPFLHTLMLCGFDMSQITYPVLQSQNPNLTSIEINFWRDALPE